MSDQNRAALIIIGNEILSGRTQDANTAWIGERLNRLGIVLHQVRVVPDIEDEIITAIHDLKDKVAYLFTTGGIGPTHDDITAEAVAKAFDMDLELNKEAYAMLLAHYGDESLITPARAKMAMIPQGADLVLNPVSGAPGFRIENVYVMAGVPRIMQAMFDDISSKLKGGDPILSATIACDLAESAIAERLGKIQANYPHVDIGSYPNYRGGILGLSLVLRSTDKEKLNAATEEVIQAIHQLGGSPKAISNQSEAVSSS